VPALFFLGEFSTPGGRKKSEKENLSVNSTKFVKILKYFAKF